MPQYLRTLARIELVQVINDPSSGHEFAVQAARRVMPRRRQVQTLSGYDQPSRSLGNRRICTLMSDSLSAACDKAVTGRSCADFVDGVILMGEVEHHAGCSPLRVDAVSSAVTGREQCEAHQHFIGYFWLHCSVPARASSLTRIGTDPHELTSLAHVSMELDAAPRLHPVITDLCMLSRRLVGAALDDGTRSGGAGQPACCRSADQ